MSKKFNWPLQVDSHSLWDKLKVSAFVLSGARLTQGDLVKKYERKWWDLIQSPFPPVMVSSGSTANILISMWVKHKIGDQFETKKEVLVPAATWPTSINNWLTLGFKPVFFDVSLKNYGMDYDAVKEYVEKNHDRIACIFPTSLIGMTFDLRLIELAKKFGIEFAQDNCEASFNYIERSYESDFDKFGPKKIERYRQYICSLSTSSTSTYIGHYASSIEGGLIFPQTECEFRFYLMNRNHGMIRSLIPYQTHLTSYTGLGTDEGCWESLYNHDVDPLFDFVFIGNNFRSTDLNAKFGLLDSNRWKEYMEHRKNIGKIWSQKTSFKKPDDFNAEGSYPFSLPICADSKDRVEKIKRFLKENGIEYRSLVAGNLTRQSCYKNLGYKNNFSNSDFLHEKCLYIGIPNKLDKALVEKTANLLSIFI
jgi:CDP-6-deoxy-D-xylo-4-hexulose-3-dehydrase